MKTSEKESLFTAINEEQCATVSGGDLGLTIIFPTAQIYSDPNDFLAAAAAYGVDLDKLKKDLAAAEIGVQQ